MGLRGAGIDVAACGVFGLMRDIAEQFVFDGCRPYSTYLGPAMLPKSSTSSLPVRRCTAVAHELACIRGEVLMFRLLIHASWSHTSKTKEDMSFENARRWTRRRSGL